MTDKKKFGLVMPKKTETFKIRTNSIFNDESDEDEKDNKRPKIPQKKLETKTKLKNESVEDPSIYEYDSIYDEMKAKQTESITPKQEKNSRYVETLLKAADKRKKEYERRIDKKIQVEREKEGDKYKDKEAFVTSAYKKKMQEKEEEEERERRENMLNDMMDVTKQKDLSGFYRHFLNQTVGEEKVPVFGEKQIKQEVVSDQDDSSNKLNENAKDDKNIDQDSDGIEIDDDDDSNSLSSDGKSDMEKKNEKASRKRVSGFDDRRCKYPKQASDDNKSKTVQSPKCVKTYFRKSSKSSNSEAESSDSDNEVNQTPDKISHSDKHKQRDKSNKTNKRNSRHDSSSSEDEQSNKSANFDIQSDTSKSEKNSKINIYTKRNVGDVFAEAQARYFQRMAARESGI